MQLCGFLRVCGSLCVFVWLRVLTRETHCLFATPASKLNHMATTDSPSDYSPSPSRSKEMAQVRAARLRNATNRMAYITGQLQDLPEPPPPKPLVPSFSSPSDSLSPHSPTQSTYSTSPSTHTPLQATHPMIHFVTYLLSFSVVALLVSNTLALYPSDDRRALAYTYLGTLLVVLVVLSRRVWTVVWQMNLTCFLWIAFVECHQIIKGKHLGDSPLVWIFWVSFLFEFLVVRILAIPLIKSLLATQGPIVGLVKYFARLVIILILVIVFPSLVSDANELPTWMNYGGGGIFVWTCLSMLVGSCFSAKLL
eukprot:Phypoly_transcript_02762.p1 GENE.Phypoly_transcript_02762~~Phypoly_transcript_02762.p1  ORF type:complete len:309 (+),score=39.06 Phypoly_transcript_02762:1672-2598(+)